MQYKVIFFLYIFFSAIGYSDALRFEKSTESPTPEALPEASVSFYSAGAKDSAEEQTARRTPRLWDRHTRNRCPQDRPQGEKGKIAREDCDERIAKIIGEIARGKRNGTITRGRAGREARATAGPDIPQHTTKGRRRELSLRRPFIAIPGIPYSLYWNLALISSTDINAPKSTPSQIQIMFVVRLSAPAPLTTLFSIVMLANEKPRTVIALSEQ